MVELEDPSFVINRSAKPTLLYVGQSKVPVFVLDNYAVDLASLREDVVGKAEFSSEQEVTIYPGYQADLPSSYISASLRAVVGTMRKLYRIPESLDLSLVQAFYGFVSTQNADLSVPQRLPHIDSFRPFQFAILHYITDGDFGGTAFYRHQPTGLERVFEPDVDEYFDSRDNYLKENGDPEPRYIVESNEHYKQIAKIDYCFNRALIYPANLLHSGIIRGEQDISSDPNSARVTANIFVNFE